MSLATDSDMEEEDKEEVDEKVMKEEEESNGIGDNSYWEEEMRKKGKQAGE